VTAPFTPTFRGGQPGARLVADLASTRPYGALLSYEELAAQLGVDIAEMPRILAAANRAKRVLLREHMRTLVAVPGRGYKILHPNEMAGLATSFRRKSDRSIRRAIAVIKGTDDEHLTDAERARHYHVGMVLEALHDRQKDTEARVTRLEGLMLSGGRRPKVIPGEVAESARAIEAAPGEPG